MSIKLEVWGDYALFTRPEFSVERMSYDVMTPSAARGILESVYWHPGLKWIIDRIYLLSPIKFANIRRNEVKAKADVRNKVLGIVNKGEKTPLYLNAKKEIQQRASTVLKDVRYVIEAHFEMTAKANESDNAGKFQDIIRRRASRGQCFQTPYLGCREFPAQFKLCESGEIRTVYGREEEDLGFMLYDMDYSDPENIKPMFFRAVLKKGVLDLTDCEVHR